MKKIFRMIVFSALGIYLTSLWNKGFLINLEPLAILKASIIIGLIYYLIIPLSRVVFFPFNLVTFGLFSIFAYGLVFFLFFSQFDDLITIKSWNFTGLKINLLSLSPMTITHSTNVFLSSLSIIVIINLLEKLL
ncbi:MAG: phage holin family protein [Patescibacteria group bacterium]|nr:phage holin family protein [Patescibacteria group bacterium]